MNKYFFQGALWALLLLLPVPLFLLLASVLLPLGWALISTALFAVLLLAYLLRREKRREKFFEV